jgi:hypothetical protein
MTAIEHKGVCYVGSDFATTAALIERPRGFRMTVRTRTGRRFSFVVLAPHSDDAWHIASTVLHRETGRRAVGYISQKID